MKVGDEIKVFEVLTDGGYDTRGMIPGTFRPQARKPTKYAVMLLDGRGLSTAMYNNTECRHVATMRITKLK